MSWVSQWIEKRRGGPVQSFISGLQPLEEMGLRELRRRLIGDLRGRILEIGCGTGFNFAHYHPEAEVTAIEPFAPFREYAAQQAAAQPTNKVSARIDVQQGDAQQLSFADGEFDAVIGTLVFCSIPDPGRALAEIRRVAKRGAEVRLIEHVRHERPLLGLLQDMANPLWQFCEGSGCNLNRNTVETIRHSGYTIRRMDNHSLPGVEGVLFPVVEIYATT